VDAGIAESTFVSPKTLAGYSRWATKLNANSPITPGTGTKVTVDANGLVTSLATANTADITEDPSNLYYTDSRAIAAVGSSFKSIAYNDNSVNTLLGTLGSNTILKVYRIPTALLPQNGTVDFRLFVTYLQVLNSPTTLVLRANAFLTNSPTISNTIVGSLIWTQTIGQATTARGIGKLDRSVRYRNGTAFIIPSGTNNAASITDQGFYIGNETASQLSLTGGQSFIDIIVYASGGSNAAQELSSEGFYVTSNKIS
jgi:hypothetical protein